MSLSEHLLRLSSQARQLETSAEAIRKNDEAGIRRRKAELGASIDAARIRLGNDLVNAGDQFQSDRADEKVSIAESFAALKRHRALRRARLERSTSARDPASAEADALADIDFAIYAIQEAEYSILDAVTA
jgi:hypothetical protein